SVPAQSPRLLDHAEFAVVRRTGGDVLVAAVAHGPRASAISVSCGRQPTRDGFGWPWPRSSSIRSSAMKAAGLRNLSCCWIPAMPSRRCDSADEDAITPSRVRMSGRVPAGGVAGVLADTDATRHALAGARPVLGPGLHFGRPQNHCGRLFDRANALRRRAPRDLNATENRRDVTRLQPRRQLTGKFAAEDVVGLVALA